MRLLMLLFNVAWEYFLPSDEFSSHTEVGNHEMWIHLSHKTKTYLWIVCKGIYESQGGLGEEGTWTACNHWGCSSDQGVMREVVHLLQTRTFSSFNFFMNNNNKLFSEGTQDLCSCSSLDLCTYYIILSLAGDWPTCVKGTEQSPRPTLKDALLMCAVSVHSASFWTPGFLLLNRTVSELL